RLEERLAPGEQDQRNALGHHIGDDRRARDLLSAGKGVLGVTVLAAKVAGGKAHERAREARILGLPPDAGVGLVKLHGFALSAASDSIQAACLHSLLETGRPSTSGSGRQISPRRRWPWCTATSSTWAATIMWAGRWRPAASRPAEST